MAEIFTPLNFEEISAFKSAENADFFFTDFHNYASITQKTWVRSEKSFQKLSFSAKRKIPFPAKGRSLEVSYLTHPFRATDDAVEAEKGGKGWKGCANESPCYSVVGF